MRRTWKIASLAGAGLLTLAIAWQISSTSAQDPENGGKGKATDSPLPIRQVVLFNSGVGYFQHEGEVDGNSNVDLTFPVGDINDLLKSLVLQDLGGGRISTVSYDSHDPIDKTLRSFAVDLNNNPSFAQILNQARGEKIEITRLEKKDAQPTKVTGAIIGMEAKISSVTKDAASLEPAAAVAEEEYLNLSTNQGMQSLPLKTVLGVKFVNPVLEGEFLRALKVLAQSHDVQKKRVSLGFNGAGKRAVRVGYVVERPIWKTSYRLRMEPGGKVFLQGWAMVENPSDDDWTDVRMVLVSGKPISFQMNLYEPLYMPRPFVEPELFASLRPPIYGGSLEPQTEGAPPDKKMPAANSSFGGQFGAQGGGFNRGFGQGFGGGGFGGFRGQLGQFNQNVFFPFGGQFGQFGQYGQGQFGAQGGGPPPAPATNRLTYEELLERRKLQQKAQEEAKKAGNVIAGLNFKEGIQSVATASEIGDYYQYVLDQKITLPRQKSAMVPILDQSIEGAKVSIYNEDTHAKYPLLGLRLKNTSNQPLTQGPITVYDNSTYAGDTRILDFQPNEERLLSYALDQSTEIKSEVRATPSAKMHFRIDEANLTARYIMRETKTYTIKNRAGHDRTVIVEHPIRPGWKLAGNKPSEQTRDVYRFTTLAPAGKTVAFDVAEEQPRIDPITRKNGTPLYAELLGIGIKTVAAQVEDKVLEVKIQNDTVRVFKTLRESKTYFVANRSDQDREFTIDHVVRPMWRAVDDKGLEKKGPGVFQFKLAVPKGETLGKEIIEEKSQIEHVSLDRDGKPHYSLGLGLVVRSETQRDEPQLIGLKIHKGVLQATRKLRESTTFVVQNNSADDREFIIDQPVRPEWSVLDEHGDPIKTGPEIFRFKLPVAKGKAASKQLREEHVQKDKDVPLKEVAEHTLKEYLTHAVSTGEIKAALTKTLALAAKHSETATKLADAERQLEAQNKDQARLRSNLQIIPQSSEHYKKFLEKFVAQESEIENLQKQVRQLQALVETHQREYEVFVANLSAE